MERVSDVFVSYDKFNVLSTQECFQSVWHWSIYIGAIYLIVVYSAQNFVTVRPFSSALTCNCTEFFVFYCGM